MDTRLLESLAKMSAEEEAILGGEPLDKRIYTLGDDFVVDSWHLLGRKRAVSVRTHTRYVAFPPHRHNFVEMMIVLAGSITHRIEGDEVTLRPGDILFLNKHITHSIAPSGEGDIGVNIIMSDDFVDSVAATLGGSVFASLIKENGRADGGGMYLHFSVGESRSISNLVENLLIELTAENPEMYPMSRTAALLLYYLSREESALLGRGGVPTTGETRRMMEISSYIKENYRTGSLSELSGRLYLSPPYLSRLTSEYFGKSFKELLLDERMARAKELLMGTDMPVGDVIRAVGYENESYFHRRFRETFGTTPFSMRREGESQEKS